MIKTTYQTPEIRDANDNIIQQGAFGKNTALANSTNDGWIDYVANDLEFLYDLAKDEVVPVPSLPASGQLNKTYLLTTTGVSYRWSGTQWVAVSSSEAVGRAETAANLAEQWATKTDGTVDGTEYSAKYYAQQAEASADDAQDTADDMADHLVQIDKNTGGVAKNSKRISNIEKLLQGNLYDYDTDDDVAYTKTVPAGALPYAGVEKVGGKTIVMNQLNTNNASYNSTGLTVTKNGDGSYTLNGTSTAAGAIYFTPSQTKWNGVYLIKGCPAGGNNAYGIGIGATKEDTGQGAIVTKSANASFRFNCNSGVTFDNVTFYPQVFNLTRMFGAGNEPSTVAEFEAMFPASYYPYNAGTLLSAGVTSVVSKDSNDATLQTLSIPAEVQALEGYGWSAGSVYNYIDYERKVFVKRVGAVDLGSLNWVRCSNTYPALWYANIADRADGWSEWCGYPRDVLTGRIQWSTLRDNDKSWTISAVNASYPKRLWINDSDYTSLTPAQFKEALAGKIAHYELATPVETDISQYLTDNLIEVGAGGALTFPNSNGDDYHIPVPSDVTYMIDLQEAIENGN